MWFRFGSEILVVLLGTVTGGLAQAQSYSFDYQAPDGCPQKQDLAAQVTARTSAVVPVSDHGAYRFKVRVASRPDGTAVGDLEVRPPSGKLSLRTVDGERCEEVTAAIALIMALALDPNAKLEPIETLLPPPTIQKTAPPLPQSPSVGAAGPVPVEDPPAAVDTPRAPRARRLDSWLSRPRGTVGLIPKKPSPEVPSGLSVGMQAEWLSALAPNGGLPLVGGHLSWRQSGPLSLRLGGSLSPKQTRSDDPGVAVRSSYFGGRLDFGWMMLFRSPWVLDAVVTTTLGRLNSEGVVGGRVAASQPSRTTWFAAGPGLHVGLESKGGSLGIDLSVPVSIVQPKLMFDTLGRGSEEVFTAPPVGLHLGIAGAWRLL